MPQSDLKKIHLKFLKEQGPFTIACNHIIFSNEEISLLQKYGHWFRALENGELPPITEKQRLFVEVASGKKTPVSFEEYTWFKYKARLRIEEQKGDILYRTPTYIENGFYTRDDYNKQKKQMSRLTWANTKVAAQLKFKTK
ncbi:MAG: hypothetical protein CL605_09450 [Altibacter sp.]|uniref:DUF413 domain-containing protein n=1 Tax=Altibacter sp. TaxID=2024823 RepID=UPI000C91D2C7|nr:DUF413 domain-containing protein [Altibacter sp.]MAP55114.1 hypothetical protein [Altibacter sp.]